MKAISIYMKQSIREYVYDKMAPQVDTGPRIIVWAWIEKSITGSQWDKIWEQFLTL